jgi:hypothetical protein
MIQGLAADFDYFKAKGISIHEVLEKLQKIDPEARVENQIQDSATIVCTHEAWLAAFPAVAEHLDAVRAVSRKLDLEAITAPLEWPPEIRFREGEPKFDTVEIPSAELSAYDIPTPDEGPGPVNRHERRRAAALARKRKRR